MEDTLKGLLILGSTFAVFTFVLTGCMEMRLKKIENDSKYIN